MENLTVTRTNCNIFVFSYSDTVKDLTINIREVSLISNWDGNLSLLPIYLTIVIPHVISPSIIPNTYTLELPSDKIYTFEYVQECNWYLPSITQLTDININLVQHDIGGFRTIDVDHDPVYWSSTESNNKGLPSDCAKCFSFSNQTINDELKSSECYVRSVRSYRSTIDYAIGAETTTGFIFYKDIVSLGIFDYMEAAKSDCEDKSIWSNLSTLNDYLGITSPDKYFGLHNTDIIINQVGHITSAALIATQYPIVYTTYSLYTIFCDLLACRLSLLNRVLGELDNCKEECDCIAVYDYNAFSVIYEAIVSLYENIFNILNIDIENTTLTADEIETLTTFEELMIQYKKYCISCEKPCKNC